MSPAGTTTVPVRAMAALGLALAVAGCRAPQSVYRPTTDNTGVTPAGQAAAVYEVPLGRDKGGQIQVWSEAVDTGGDGRGAHAGSFRVGLILRNDASTPMSVNPADVLLRFRDIPDLRPRETQEVAVPPGQTTEMLLRYPMPGRFGERPPDAYEVAWTVHFGSATYRQTTAFSRQGDAAVPRPLDSSAPEDRGYMEGSEKPQPVGIPWGGPSD